MKALKPHKLCIKNKAPGSVSTGLNTEVLLDGKPLLATGLELKVRSNGITTVKIELIADVEVDDMLIEDLQLTKARPSPLIDSLKEVLEYELTHKKAKP